MTRILMSNYHSSMFIIYVVYCVHVCDRYTTRVRCSGIILYYLINCAGHDIIIIMVMTDERTNDGNTDSSLGIQLFVYTDVLSRVL